VDLGGINLAELTDHSVSVEVVQPGDVLDISMVTDYTRLTTATTAVRVADDGTVVVPLVGKTPVAGMEVEQAERMINAESVRRGLFCNPCITVTMKQCRTRKVTVVGAVNKPGTHELPRGSTSLMAALVAADGLSKEADTLVEIRHADSRETASVGPISPPVAGGPGAPTVLASYEPSSPAVVKVDLAAAAAGAVKVPELRDGDVVYVVKRTLRPIHVIGLVCRPGEFPYPTDKEIRVLDALALAGGVSNPVAERMFVIRKMSDASEPVRIAVSLQAAKNGGDNLALAPGDTLTVEQTPLTAAVGVLQSFCHLGIGATLPLF